MSGGPLRPDGTFTIPNVAPGQYHAASRRPAHAAGPGAASPPEFSVAILTVDGDDVTDVRLTPVVPVTISGRISFDDPASAQSIKPAAVRIATQQLDDAAMSGIGLPGGNPPSVHDDWTFEARATAGQIALRPLAGEMQVKAIRVERAGCDRYRFRCRQRAGQRGGD